MKPESLSNRIRKYVRRQYPAVVNGGELERLAFENGFKASNASRRARELENDGILKVSYTEKGSAEYQYIPSEHELIKINITGSL